MGDYDSAKLFKPYLFAFEPMGAELGQLPYPTSFTVVTTTDDLPTLEVYYSLDAPHHDWIQDGKELAVMWPEYSPGSSRPTPQEAHMCRFVQMGKSRDRLDRTEMWKYSYIGIGYLLRRAIVREPDDMDPELGDQRPVRHFPAPGSSAVPYYGRVMSNLWDEEVAAVGWGGGADGLTRNYGGVSDGDGNPWADESALPVELGLDENLEQVDGRFKEAGKRDAIWIRRVHQAYNPGTFGRDLTATVLLRDGDAMTSASQDVDFQPVTSHLRILGDKGLYWDFENPDPDLLVTMHGSAETVPITRSDCLTLEAAQAYADEYFAEEAKVIDSQSREQNFAVADVLPWRDYRLYDKVKVQRGRAEAREQRVPDTDEIVCGITVTVDKTVHGKITFGARRRNLGAKLVKKVGSIQGAGFGVAGLRRDPGDDPREPEKVLNVAATVTNYADRNNRGAGKYVLTWDAVTMSAPDEDGRYGPILVRQYDIDWKSPDVDSNWQRFRSVVGTQTTVTLRGFDPDAGDTFRVRAQSHAGPLGAWSDNLAGVVPGDEDPGQGADLIVDWAHQNADVRSKRATDAGAGFAFTAVSGEYVAEFTSTTPVLDYGRAGTQKNGRAAVRAGDVVVVDLSAWRSGGSAASVNAQVRWYAKDGTVISTVDVIPVSTVTTLPVTYTGTVTAPSGSAKFGTRVKAGGVTGGAILRVQNVNADRRTVETRMADSATSNRVMATDAATGAKIHATDNLTSKHTSTAALLQAASGTSGWKGGTGGLYYYLSGTAVFSATGAGVYVKGTIETGSGMIIGGTGLLDIVFASGYSIGTNGGFLEYNASGSGHKMNGSLNATGAVTIGGAVQLNGSTFVNGGDATVNGSGGTLSFYGNTRVTRQTVTGSRGANAALTSLLSALNSLGLVTNLTT